MIRTQARSFLLAALALPVFAQQPAAKTAPPVGHGPVLVLKTAQAQIATMVAMRFESTADLPEMPAGGHYVLTLGADHKVKVETGAGDVGMLEIAADPGALMDLFAEQVEAARPIVRGTMTVALQAQGMKPKDVAELVDGIFAFPKQMQQLTLKVVGDPENPAQDGVDVTLGMEPKPGAGFATFVEAMQPCSQGAPMLPGGNPAMTVQFSLDPKSLEKLFAPFREIVINMTNQGAEQRQAAGAMYDRWMKLYDGGVSAAFDDKFQGHALIGVLDGEKLQQLMASEDYLAMLKGQMMMSRELEIEVTPNVFEHRGVKVTKSKISGGEPNPMMPDGSMEAFVGAVGNCMFTTFGGKEPLAKATIDALVDQKVKRAPLPAGTLMQMTMDLHAFVAAVQAQMGHGDFEPGEDMPAKMTMSFGKRDKALQLHVHVQ